MTAAMAETATTLEEMATTMDIGTTSPLEESPRASTMQVNYDHGRVSVAVTGTDPTPAEEGGEDRWQVARRRMRRQAAGAAGGKSVPVVSATTPPAAPKNQARFAKQVAARLTKAARMPHALPKEDIKVILRPRGGLNVARTEAPKLMEAIFEMAGTTLQESREDTICTNNAQNIIVISTPHEQRARMYSGIRLLRIAGREHEVSAYVPAP